MQEVKNVSTNNLEAGSTYAKLVAFFKEFPSSKPRHACRTLGLDHKKWAIVARQAKFRVKNCKRLNVGVQARSLGVHGPSFWFGAVSSVMYERLDVPVVNARSDMKQLGFKGDGSPYSVQIEPNGTIRVYVRDDSCDWRGLLLKDLIETGLCEDEARFYVDDLRLVIKELHYPVDFVSKDSLDKWPQVLARRSEVMDPYGICKVKIDRSPTDSTFEMIVDFQNLDRYLAHDPDSHIARELQRLRMDLDAVKEQIHLDGD